MASLWNRFKEFVGLGEDPLEAYEEIEGYADPEPKEDRRRRVERLQQPEPMPTPEEQPRRRAGNVIGMPNATAQAEVFVIEPKTFEDAPQLIVHLRERKSVVLNLTLMDPEQAQRTVDFVAGATYAIDGHQERLGDGIFLFTPSSVQITSAKNQPVRTEEKITGPFKFDADLWRSGT